MIGTIPEFWNAAGVSTSGILTMISLPGLKPSARFMSVGSIGVPPMFFGIDSAFRLRRLPVAVEASLTVK